MVGLRNCRRFLHKLRYLELRRLQRSQVEAVELGDIWYLWLNITVSEPLCWALSLNGFISLLVLPNRNVYVLRGLDCDWDIGVPLKPSESAS